MFGLFKKTFEEEFGRDPCYIASEITIDYMYCVKYSPPNEAIVQSLFNVINKYQSDTWKWSTKSGEKVDLQSIEASIVNMWGINFRLSTENTPRSKKLVVDIILFKLATTFFPEDLKPFARGSDEKNRKIEDIIMGIILDKETEKYINNDKDDKEIKMTRSKNPYN